MTTVIEVPGTFRFSGDGKVEFVLTKYGTAVDFGGIPTVAALQEKLFDMANLGYLELCQRLKDSSSEDAAGDLSPAVNRHIEEAQQAVADQAKRVEEHIAAQKARVDEYARQVEASLAKAK
jgi:hypothetical protein